jgi:hypothetical protein
MRACLAVIAIVGCGSGSGAPADAPKLADAYDTARCLIKGDYGALGAVTGTAGQNGPATTITVVLDPGPPGKDDFFIKLVPGKGVFAAGVAAGTYTIAGVDANFINCGLCTNLIADIVASSGPSKFYFTDSCSMTLTSVTPPIQGSAQNLHFVEVDLSGNVVPGGCTASIASVTFSTP